MVEYWWKNAVLYGVDVGRFCDSDGDGIGDFKGLTSKLPYISDLGATCIWLLPFFPSTGRDNGYDITDYYRIDSKFGVFEDFTGFIRAAGERGIRVIVDFVAHHTSNEHPWFQSARHDPASPYRDYYVWADHPPPPAPGRGSIFPGQEDGVWTFDELAGLYYHHRFYHFQPGLNHRNPRLRDELERIMDFWLSFGIAGFRVDAASHMIEDPLDPAGAVDKSHSVLRHIYSHVMERKPGAVLLGEVDEDEHKLKTFFDGEQLNMMFNFFLDNYLLLALATESAEPIRNAMSRLPPPPENGQWANFLRNLDEADLERLNGEETEATLAAFAPDEKMRIYGRGIRRRLAPMLDGDLKRLKLAYSLLYSLPGAPMICYGDEIGMGEDLAQDGRNSVRSPMQWDAGRNGGFSTGPKARLAQAMIEDGPYGAKRVNVEKQLDDPQSLLSFVKKLGRERREHRAIGEQDCRMIETKAEEVLAHGFRYPDYELVMVHNLCGKAVSVTIERDAAMSEPPVVLIGGDVDASDVERLGVKLEPYGMRWLKWPR